RKNWMFSETPRGAESSAIYYSMIETAKTNNISPYAYLNYILTNRDLLKGEEREIKMLFPWSRSAKESCSIK
nr:transposase domain-containing protein [Lachnospiraceae bacterium]